eukprot:2980258-Amphidinium_carterae.1
MPPDADREELNSYRTGKPTPQKGKGKSKSKTTPDGREICFTRASRSALQAWQSTCVPGLEHMCARFADHRTTKRSSARRRGDLGRVE